MYLKVGICCCHAENVNGLDLLAVGSYLLWVHIVHKGLYQSALLDAAHVKAVHIVPEVNLLLPAGKTGFCYKL